ncbi:MAG: integration host factor subunit beta [Elusimicrobia bacterium]|nr:integration host factor subunit beta [Elusimicrobiota bacterium]
MNKHDIAKSLAKILPTQKQAQEATDKVFDEISRALSDGQKVVITGLGTFSVIVTKTKRGRNPNTGEKLLIPPMKKIRFKQSKDFFNKD